VTHFDEKAKTWDSDPDKIIRARAVAQGIRSRVPLIPGMSAFEYGCGTGLLSFELHEDLTHITLADSSAGMLAVLQEKISSGRIQNMNAVRLDLAADPLPPERFALVTTMMTLHHVRDTDKLLLDFFNLLECPGFLCVADLDREDGSFHGSGFSGHKGFDREVLRQQAVRAGFREAGFETVYTMSRGEGRERRNYTLFLMIAEKK
jgi:ubiquinone/menaquinone biosynthesis C-methylase UbiE